MTKGQFRKKPVVITAWRWDNEMDTYQEIYSSTPEPMVSAFHADGGLRIITREGVMTADLGDWVIKGVQGELYPCKPEIFEATYTQEPALAATQ